MVQQIQKIVIVGGGTAGWMAAAALSKFFESRKISIQLVESDDIGTVGVGEATVPGIHQFNRYLDISELDFIKATQATFKLGIEFKDWFKQEHTFFHPFADYGLPINGVNFYQCWLKMQKSGYVYDLEDFCLATQIAKQRRFAQVDHDLETPLALYNYAYHFDASLYAKFLRNYAEQRGVIRQQGKIVSVAQNSSTGFIESVTLTDGQVISGQLFIDCSGFAGLLIDKTLKTEYINWSKWLPCDRAIALQTENVEDATPYTSSFALTAGWQWKIPLQHRVGNGYVYSSNVISEDEAIESLLINTSGAKLTSPRVIKFTAGMRKNFFVKNCVALGLASGFLEPLESTSISLIQTGITKLINYFPDMSFDSKKIAEVNRLNEMEYSRVRDFIILHYKANQRNVNDFWKALAAMDVPETLQNKMTAFKKDGTLISYELESFQDASWLSMYNGFKITPEQCIPDANNLDVTKLKQVMEKIKLAIQQGVLHAPTQKEFLSSI
ncbi:MAG: tryptophan 7-halogenase [Gammaproteobacteria bacterium]|nr:MAG: tryptophan 7-halogenase [Gammaproteobacteria bacterium]